MRRLKIFEDGDEGNGNTRKVQKLVSARNLQVTEGCD